MQQISATEAKQTFGTLLDAATNAPVAIERHGKIKAIVASPAFFATASAQQGQRMYLVCRFDSYDNERSLALHRIISAKASSFTFERPAEFDLKKFDDDGRFGYGNGKKIKLAFRIEKDAGLHLLESPLSEDQQVVEEDETYWITATVVDSYMLDWWLRGFGDAVSDISKGGFKYEVQHGLMRRKTPRGVS